MWRFTAGRMLRDAIQQINNRALLNAVTSRSQSHSGFEMEITGSHSRAESELKIPSNCNVNSDMDSSNSYVDIQITPIKSFFVESKALIHKHSNKNLEEEISCSPSEEMTINFSDTEENAVKPRVSILWDTNFTEKTPSGHCYAKSNVIYIDSSSCVESANEMYQSHSPLEPKVMTSQSHAESGMFILNSDSHAKYRGLKFPSDSNVESLDMSHFLTQPYESQIINLAHAGYGGESHKDSKNITQCICLADCIEAIPSSHFPVEADEVTIHNLKVPDNIFRMLPEDTKSHHNKVNEDTKDSTSISNTDSEVVTPDPESKIETPDIKSDAQTNKNNSVGFSIISEEMLESVAFTDSEMVIPEKHLDEESKIGSSNVQSGVKTRGSNFHQVPATISFGNTIDASCPSPAKYNDNENKLSLTQWNEDCNTMDEFFDVMKEHVQQLTQDEFLEMLKICDFRPYVNPYTGELGGPKGPEPTRYGEWEIWGKCVDF